MASTRTLAVTPFPGAKSSNKCVNQFVTRDSCPTHLLTRYLRRGLHLPDLQKIVFAAIEAEVDCAPSQSVMAAHLPVGWTLHPGTAVGAITRVLHFASEDAARDCTAETVIENVLPKASAQAQAFAYRHGR